jgi:hypothetical protein
MTDVSLKQGHASLVPPNVTTAPALSPHHSSKRPTLFSQFRGPFVFNETDEERLKREEDERKKKEDEEKKSNFQKVKEAREKAEAERDALLKEKAEREAADKKAAEAKLSEEKKFEELANQREKEVADAKAETAAAKAEADKANARLKEIADQQEKDLTALLDTIPEDKRPPLDPSDPVEKRLKQVQYAHTFLGTEPKPAVGAGARKGDGDSKDRIKALNDAQKIRHLTDEEAFEMMSLGGEQ